MAFVLVMLLLDGMGRPAFEWRKIPAMSKAAIIPWAVVVVRTAVGLVFLASGVLKLLSPDAATALLDHLFSLGLPISHTLTLLLSLTECAAGGLLMAGKYVPAVAFASCMFLLGSTVVGMTQLSDPLPCGCFGSATESRTDEYFLIRNMVLLAFA